MLPKYAPISCASSGSNTLIAAVPSRQILVLSVALIASGPVGITFKSAAAGAALTGEILLLANGGFVLPHNPYGWFITALGELLSLNLSLAVAVGGCLSYVEA